MHPSVNYQLWTYPPGCTAGAADSPVPGYELSFDSSPSYSSIMIDTPSSPLAVSATVEEQRESTPDTENLPALPRKAAGRTPRKPYPVIVPNLTKKARGRQVPTKDMLLQSGSGRVFACQVDNCRKVFTRSEHLKRHTRSIHTHEKRKWHALYYIQPRQFNFACVSPSFSLQVRGAELWQAVYTS